VESTPEVSEIDSSFLITLSIGLGSLAILLAGAAVYLLLQNQGAFTKAKYRSNHATAASEEEPSQQSSN